jgi:hypothetical protein
MDDNMRADLCVEAFQNACRDDGAEGMILHSDYAEENTMSKFFQIVLYKGFFAETSA